MTFLRVEKRGPNCAKYYYLCSYNPKTRNVHKRYLGPVSSVEATRTANFYTWLNTLDREKVKKLRDEALAAEKSGPDFHTSLERVLELGEYVRQL